MSSDFLDPHKSRALEALGISDTEEKIYRILLSNKLATATDITRLLSLPLADVEALLAQIEVKGLATQSLDKPSRYIAAPPELAIEALASQRQADIERARLSIPSLKEEVSSSAQRADNDQIVELITNRKALNQILRHLHKTSQHDVMSFQRAPMVVPNSHQQEIRPGLRVRSISDASYLKIPGSVESLRSLMKMGEECRFFATLPVKMFIVDRRIGLIPLNADDLTGPMLLLRTSALLDALCLVYELLWERSTPMVLNAAGKLKIGSAARQLSEEAEEVMPLLAAGLHDKAVASELGISSATLTRRISELARSFGTRTRFQLGWRAALEMHVIDSTRIKR